MTLAMLFARYWRELVGLVLLASLAVVWQLYQTERAETRAARAENRALSVLVDRWENAAGVCSAETERLAALAEARRARIDELLGTPPKVVERIVEVEVPMHDAVESAPDAEAAIVATSRLVDDLLAEVFP